MYTILINNEAYRHTHQQTIGTTGRKKETVEVLVSGGPNKNKQDTFSATLSANAASQAPHCDSRPSNTNGNGHIQMHCGIPGKVW